MDTTSDLLANVDFVLCLDSVGNANPLKLHVSKPPKEGSPGEVFLRHLNSVSKEVFKMNNVDCFRTNEVFGIHDCIPPPQLFSSPPVEVVHKKINLADDR